MPDCTICHAAHAAYVRILTEVSPAMSLYSRLHPTPAAEPEDSPRDPAVPIMPAGMVEGLNRRGEMMPEWVRRNVNPATPRVASKELSR